MKVIVRPRQHGKTLELIKMCYLNPGYAIVVPTQRFKDNIRGLSLKHGFPVPKLFTVDEVQVDRRHKIGEKITGILVDNADYILTDHLGLYGNYNLKAISIDGLPREQDYDERADYNEYKNLTYQQFRDLKDKALGNF